jgi:hypothetical protein
MPKKDTPALRKVSTKKKQPDPLKPFRQQSERILALCFDDDSTPDFIRDLTFEMLSELEGETQVYWNRREIAAVAIPRMLKAAHEQGIDFFSERSEIFNAAAFNLRQRADSRITAPPSESEQLQDEMEADAAAIIRILHSPHVPEMVKRDLGDRVCELDLHPTDNAAVFRVAWPLAVLKAMKQEKEETREEAEETQARITRDQIVTRKRIILPTPPTQDPA